MANYDKSAYEIGREFNVSAVSVYKWVKKGCPYQKKQEGLREIMYFNLDEVKKWIEERRQWK